MSNQRVSIIVALDEKRGIGRDNDLLFRIPQDFKRMKMLTSGHPLVMGRKTYESIGRPLPNRTNIVITRDKYAFVKSHPEFISGFKMLSQVQHDNSQNAIVVPSLEEGLDMAKKSSGNDEIFIFGGGRVFQEAMEKNLVDRLYLTLVKGDFGADVFFPDYSVFGKEIEREAHDGGEYQYSFVTLER